MIHFFSLLFCLSAVGCDGHERVGVELIYAVDDESRSANKVDLQKVLKAVQRRVGRYGTVEVMDDRIRIGVFGSDDKNVGRIKNLISRPGVLEYRILADRRFDGDLIDLATSEKFAEARDVRAKSDAELPVGQWCPVAEAEAKRLAADKQLATRKTKLGRLEALVVVDPYHITGDDFSEVYPETDPFGHPCVYFALSDDGGKRMRRLTTENLPTDVGATKQRWLAILLDGEVQSAPAIRSAIENRGQISGRFSEREVADLCAIISAGSLPVRLKLVEQATVDRVAP